MLKLAELHLPFELETTAAPLFLINFFPKQVDHKRYEILQLFIKFLIKDEVNIIDDIFFDYLNFMLRNILLNNLIESFGKSLVKMHSYPCSVAPWH